MMDQKLRVQVPIELAGTAYGVKTEGGVLDFVTRELEVECLPGDIPNHIELDVTELHVGQHSRPADREVPEGVALADEPEKVICSLGHARAEEARRGRATATSPRSSRRARRTRTEAPLRMASLILGLGNPGESTATPATTWASGWSRSSPAAGDRALDRQECNAFLGEAVLEGPARSCWPSRRPT